MALRIKIAIFKDALNLAGRQRVRERKRQRKESKGGEHGGRRSVACRESDCTGGG